MGQAVSRAEEQVAKEVEELKQMLQVLEVKRDEFLARVQVLRGEADNKKEIGASGRTVCRISEIRVASSAGPSSQLKNALASFFECAQGGDVAKNAAVEGAQQLLSTGLDALFGARKGQGLEKTGFVVLFLNFAFVRVDYYVYSYCASGEKWGAEANKSGCCYVTDLAVLPILDLTGSEIDFLVSQSLDMPVGKDGRDDEFGAIQKIKLQLTESRILSNLLKKPDLELEDLAKYSEALVQTEGSIRDAFRSLSDYVPEEFAPLNTFAIGTITKINAPTPPEGAASLFSDDATDDATVPVLQKNGYTIVAFSFSENVDKFLIQAYDDSFQAKGVSFPADGARDIQSISIDLKNRFITFIGKGGKGAGVNIGDIEALISEDNYFLDVS